MTRGLVLGALVIVGVCARQRGDQQAPSASTIQVDKVSDNLYVLGGGGNTAAFITAGVEGWIDVHLRVGALR